MTIIKPKFDTRDYQDIILDNGIHVLVISDMGTQVSAMSLAINIGGYNDPILYPGLAHFLEHMLFMGTKKYPENNFFMSEVSKYGGHTNAFTQETNTNYHFSVSNEYFEYIVEIFSNFFIDPLFDKTSVDNEIHAVDSEHKKNISNLFSLSDGILKTIINPAHPYSKFISGNMETLNKEHIHDALKEFYEKNYSSNLIKIVAINNKPIKKILKMVKKYFSKIKNKNIKVLEINEPLFIESKKIIKLEFPTNHLILSWEIPEFKKYKGKIFNYINNLFTNEATSSLLFYLKKLFLCDGIRIYNPIPTLIMVYITLTDKGLYLIPTIIYNVKEYLLILLKNGIKKWRYEEMQQNGRIWFENLSVDSPLSYIVDIAETMLKLGSNMKNVLNYNYNYPNFNKYIKKAIKVTLKKMLKDPQIIICSNIYNNLSNYDTLYKTRYEEEASDIIDSKFIFINLNLQFKLPHLNKYIPKYIKFYKTQSSSKYPLLLVNNSNYSLYYKKDVYNSPIVLISVYLYNNNFQNSRNLFLCELFVEIVNYVMQSEKYYFDVADTNFQINFGIEYMLMRIEGYNENIPQIIKLLLKQFSNINISKEEYNEILLKMKKKLINLKYVSPYNYISNQIFKNMYYPNISYENKIIEIKKSTYNDIFEAIKLIFENYKININIIGNCSSGQAIDYGKYFKTMLKYNNNENLLKINKLDDGDEIAHIYKNINPYDKNYCIAIGYQTNYNIVWENSIKNIVLTHMIDSIISEKFFHQLRTIDKTGYIVTTKIITNFIQKEHSLYLIFIVQSPNTDPIVIRSRINKFIKKMEHEIENIPHKTFYQHKQSLINEYTPNYQNIYEESSKYEVLIANNLPFDIHEKYINICKTITISEVLEFYKVNFIQKNTCKKIVFEYY